MKLLSGWDKIMQKMEGDGHSPCSKEGIETWLAIPENARLVQEYRRSTPLEQRKKEFVEWIEHEGWLRSDSTHKK